MGKKRKSQSVSKLSAAKRQAQTWNLFDNVSSPNFHERPGTSSWQPGSRRELANPLPEDDLADAVCDATESVPPFHISRSHYDRLYKECAYSIQIFHEGYSSSRDDLVGTLSEFKLRLGEIDPCGRDDRELPDQLLRQPANLMINHSGLPCHLVFDNVGDFTRIRTGPLLCLVAETGNDLIPLESLEYLCRINRGSRLRLEVKGYDPREASVMVGLSLLRGSLSQLSHPSDYAPNSSKAKDDRQHMQLLMAFCFGFDCPVPLDRRRLRHSGFTELFQQIYEHHQQEPLVTGGFSVQHRDLVPTLRPYQVKAIWWMIQKETVSSTENDELHELWKEITTADGRALYYNTFSAQFSLAPLHKLPSSPGGILADEMGLGKTVEMLACILNNPRPKEQLQQAGLAAQPSISGSPPRLVTPSPIMQLATDGGTPCDAACPDSFSSREAATLKGEPSSSREVIRLGKDRLPPSSSPPRHIKRESSRDSAVINRSPISCRADTHHSGTVSPTEWFDEGQNGSSSGKSADPPPANVGEGSICRDTSSDIFISSESSLDKSGESANEGSVDDSGIELDSPPSIADVADFGGQITSPNIVQGSPNSDEKLKDEGFPCSPSGEAEPRSGSEIAEFCRDDQAIGLKSDPMGKTGTENLADSDEITCCSRADQKVPSRIPIRSSDSVPPHKLAIASPGALPARTTDTKGVAAGSAGSVTKNSCIGMRGSEEECSNDETGVDKVSAVVRRRSNTFNGGADRHSEGSMNNVRGSIGDIPPTRSAWCVDSAGAAGKKDRTEEVGQEQQTSSKGNSCGSVDGVSLFSGLSASADGDGGAKGVKIIPGDESIVAEEKTTPGADSTGVQLEHPAKIGENVAMATGQVTVPMGAGLGHPASNEEGASDADVREDSPARVSPTFMESCGAFKNEKTPHKIAEISALETGPVTVPMETGLGYPAGTERSADVGHDYPARLPSESTGGCGAAESEKTAKDISGVVAMETGKKTIPMETGLGHPAGTENGVSNYVARDGPVIVSVNAGHAAGSDRATQETDRVVAMETAQISVPMEIRHGNDAHVPMETGRMTSSLGTGHPTSTGLSVNDAPVSEVSSGIIAVSAVASGPIMTGSTKQEADKHVDGARETSSDHGAEVMDVAEGEAAEERDGKGSEELVEEPVTVKLSCLCGKKEGKEASSIRCEECGSRQHAKCVNWVTEKECQPSPEESHRYLCPHCQIRGTPVKSAATLIISPTSISQQWVNEINRHVRSHSLKILVYRGVKVHKFLQPMFLAKQDIVITTYDVLRTELNYVNVPHSCDAKHSRKLRHAKRYMALPSPLPAVEWWRVCLDEAQMVESPTAKSAEMALHLSAVNRWCVTGTPIQTSLDDLYGLFLFLNEDPYRTKFWWDLALCSPFTRGDQEPMLRFLSKKLWRTAKSNVLDQINIPSQTEEVHWLEFSPVEAHYYKRKHEACSRDFSKALERTRVDLTMKLADMDRHTLSRLVHPLLSLRQACCHPQAVRGEFISIDQCTMKMEDLLKSLIGKNKVECEDAQRQLVCAINGQAAVHLMSGEVVEAVEKYREVLRTADEQRGKLHIDSLQIYHAMYNLSKLLEEKYAGVAPTTRDDQLQQQMQVLQDKYMSKALTRVADCKEALTPISKKIRELQRRLPEDQPGWWFFGIDYLVDVGLEEKVVERMKEDTHRLSERFHDHRGLQYVIQDEVDALMRSFKEAKAGVQGVSGPVTPQLVAQTVDCHLRPFSGEAKNDCLFCQVERSLQDYEMQLFSFQQRDLVDTLVDDTPSTSEGHAHTIRPRGTWAMSELQKILRNLHALLKTHCVDQDMVEDGAKYLEMMELMKKEFKPLRAYWGALLERVAAVDELDMAKMRLRVKLPDEPYDPESQPYILLFNEIPTQRMKLMSDRVVASSELRRKTGQLVYLQNLEKAQYGLEGSNPEPCPICTRELGQQWAIIPCGHCYCCECMSVLHSRNPSQRMKCPVCRQTAQRKEVSFVRVGEKSGESSSESSVKVLGGYSSKVEAVVKALIHIQREDRGAKSLVFSAWQDVLNIIARAMQDNHVSFHHITQVGHKHFADKISDFKTNPEISTLLLPLNVACNGLNIVEATHVLLVEPIMNPATELQAIGRVHRIGQTRHTLIHRFYVRDTIEEELHRYLKANPLSADINDKSETGNLTVDQLRGMLSFHERGQAMEV